MSANGPTRLAEDQPGPPALPAVAEERSPVRAARNLGTNPSDGGSTAPFAEHNGGVSFSNGVLASTAPLADLLRADQIIETVDAAIVALDESGRVTIWNQAAERLYGYRREEVIGQPIHEMAQGEERRRRTLKIMAAIEATGRWEGEIDTRRRDGTVVPIHVRAAAIREGEHFRGLVGVAVDMTSRVEQEKALRRAHDYARAITENMGEGVFAVDPDGRLTYMNAAAEEMLSWSETELAGETVLDLIHYLRPDGRVRTGPSEILLAARGEETKRVRDAIFVCKNGDSLPVAFTAAPFVDSDGTVGAVVVFADISDRKRQQRELQEKIDSLSWLREIRDALDQDRLLVYGQPVVNPADGETVLHELLVRMRGSEGELISPGQFLPVAEEYGMIVEIDSWMVRQAVGLAAAGHAVSVNLSAHSTSSRSLLERLRIDLEDSGADPGKILVELTETAFIEDPDRALEFVESLKELGCRLALDDFGTGYGGFSYLKRLPVDLLKIDMEFARDVHRDPASRSVVEAVVGLARSFGHRTIAEGVEDQDAYDLLRRLGVDYLQGYLVGRPAPIEELLDRKGVIDGRRNPCP